MKVLIVDDEAYVRIGMRTIVNWGELGITMVMEAADGLQALKIFKEIRPDIVLLDIVMPNMNGLEFIRAAKQLKNNCKFLILSCMDELDYYKDAINLGVSGYVLKNSLTGEHLTTVISNLIKEIDTEQIRVPSNNEIFTYASNDIVLNEFTSLALKGKIAAF